MAVDRKHRSFPGPSATTVLWRYSNLPKLLSLLTTEALYFPSLRTLRKDDPFEGLTTIVDRRLAAQLTADPDFADSFCAANFPDVQPDARQAFVRGFSQIVGGDGLRLAETCFVSCWHAKSHESAALWKLYAETQAGVAVRTTVEKLCLAVDEEEDLILGSVRYIDYESVSGDFSNGLSPVFLKRDSYEHEHEVRMLRWDHAGPEELPGRNIRCKPQQLIEEIVVSPYADDWMVDAIAGVVSRMGYEIPVRKSRLLDTSI